LGEQRCSLGNIQRRESITSEAPPQTAKPDFRPYVAGRARRPVTSANAGVQCFGNRLLDRRSNLRKGRPSARMQKLEPSEGSRIFSLQEVEPSEGMTFCARARGRTFGRDDLLHACKRSNLRKDLGFSACKRSNLRKGRPSACMQEVDLSEGTTFCMRARGRPFGRDDLLRAYKKSILRKGRPSARVQKFVPSKDRRFAGLLQDGISRSSITASRRLYPHSVAP